jgi:hypothetical protein
MKKILAVAIFAMTIPLGASAQTPSAVDPGDPTIKMCEKAEQTAKRAEDVYNKAKRTAIKINRRNSAMLENAQKKFKKLLAKIDARTQEQCGITAKEFDIAEIRCALE